MRGRRNDRGLLVAVALVSLCLAAFCLHPSFGFFLAGVIGMAGVRTAGSVRRARDAGELVGPARAAGHFLTSVALASVILVVSLTPALCLLPMINAPRMHEPPRFDGRTVLGIIVIALLAIPVATLMRRRFW